jgi:protein-tyrosine phosphatase
MHDVVKKAGWQDRIHIDSAGTAGWHAGKPADARMKKAAAARGYDLSHLARQVTKTDLAEYDLILVMDDQNRRDLRSLDPQRQHDAKIQLFCEYCTRHGDREVPDPYYGGDEGFEHVLDLMEDGCAGVLRKIQEQNAGR